MLQRILNNSSRDRRLLELQSAIDGEPEKLETTFANISRRSYQPRDSNDDLVETVELATEPVSYAYYTESALPISPPLCTKKCNICSSQYRSLELQREFEGQCYDRACTDSEASSIIAHYISTTERNLAETREMLLKYGDNLARRWLRNDPTRRGDVLRAAMPDMYATEWLEAYYLFDEKADRMAVGDRPHLEFRWRKGWLLPYINVATMSRDAQKLLVLLFLRTNRHPNDFLAYDVERTKTAFRDHHVKVCYNRHCVVMCDKAGIVGALTPWTIDGVHRGDIVGFPRAKLGFEARYEMSVFLRNITKIILENVPSDTHHGCQELNGHAEKYLNAAASGKSDLAYNDLDTLQHLQTDTLYFHEKVVEIQTSQYYRRLSEEDRMKNLLGGFVYIVGRVEIAAMIEDTVAEALDVLEAHGKDITRGQPLREPYNSALGIVAQALQAYYRTYQKGLLALLVHCDLLKHKKKHTKQTSYESFRGDRLVWNLNRLCTKAVDVSQVQSFHLHYINVLLTSSEEQKNRIDKVLCDHFSEMLVIDEAINMVANHLPHSFNGHRIKELERSLNPREMLNLDDPRNQKLLALFADVVGAGHPIETQTRTNFTKLQTTHNLTSKFWREMRKVWLERLPSTLIKSNLSAYRSEQHLADFQAECDNYEAALLQQEQATRSNGPRQPVPSSSAPQAVLATEPSTPSTPLIPISRKDKIKTRPDEETAALAQAAAQLQLADEAAAIADAPPPNPTIAVCRESIVVFGRMFGRDAGNRGLTKWLDLVAALVDAGLSPVHSGGSAVTFAHSDPTKGAITMHAPHPGITVRLTTLRSEGRRLQERFQWDENTFILQG
ncbi:hypothetical protein LTR74_001885 [Friedmanniomyces endolithicus]|nr:hypothetical protein LTR74_001885 [Friedmanniomyces endolithicus]